MGLRSLLRMVVLLSCALPVAAAQRPPDQDALAPLQGRWYSVSTESGGKQASGLNRADVHIITADEVVAVLDGTIVSKATIKRLERDAGKAFGRITLEMNSGSNRGKTWVAIYQVSGTTLRWCGHWLGEGNVLPTRFATTAGGPDFLRTMARQTQ